MGDERVWLTHPEAGGFFHCPAGAVDEWLKKGWQPSDPPEEVNPVTAERPPLAAQEVPAPKSGKKAGAQEGSN